RRSDAQTHLSTAHFQHRHLHPLDWQDDPLTAFPRKYQHGCLRLRTICPYLDKPAWGRWSATETRQNVHGWSGVPRPCWGERAEMLPEGNFSSISRSLPFIFAMLPAN